MFFSVVVLLHNYVRIRGWMALPFALIGAVAATATPGAAGSACATDAARVGAAAASSGPARSPGDAREVTS